MEMRLRKTMSWGSRWVTDFLLFGLAVVVLTAVALPHIGRPDVDPRPVAQMEGPGAAPTLGASGAGSVGGCNLLCDPSNH